ncbi:MAG: T9SS type A sorting domain-containing protein [Cyclobacteriaceae bacterium]
MTRTALLFTLLTPFITIAQETENFEWASQFGGASSDFITEIKLDGDGNSYVTGYFNGTVDLDPGAGVMNHVSNGGADIFLVKLDDSGNLLWAKSYGSSNIDKGFSLAVNDAGDVFLTGFVRANTDFNEGGVSGLVSAVNQEKAFLLKLTSNGDFLWVKSFGENDRTEGKALEVDSQGLPVLTGIFQANEDFDPGPDQEILVQQGGGDVFIVKLTSNGDLVWAKSIGSSDEDSGESPKHLSIDKDDNVIIAGDYYVSMDADPGEDSFVLTNPLDDLLTFFLKLDADGNFVWAGNFEDENATNEPSGLSVDANNNIYLTGYYGATADFDPGAGVFNLPAPNWAGFYVVKLDESMNLVWAKGITSDSEIESTGLAIGSTNVAVIGEFEVTADFDPSAESFTASSSGNFDGFILNLNLEDGSFGNVKTLQGSGDQHPTSIVIDSEDIQYITGEFEATSDLNPGSNEANFTSDGSIDAFVLKLNQYGSCENPFVIESVDIVLDTVFADASDGSDFFEFTVPQDGFISFSSCQTTFSKDEFINVYLESCDNLLTTVTTTLECVGNVEWKSPVLAGEKYLFEWDMDYSNGATIDIITPAFFYSAGYQGYNCATAISVDCLGEFETEFRRVPQWFKWIAPSTGTFELGLPPDHEQPVDAGGIDILMEVKSQCGVNSIANNDPEDEFVFDENVQFSATEGEDYFFLFQNYGYVTTENDPLLLQIVEQGVTPMETLEVEIKDVFSNGVMLVASDGTGTYQWFDAAADLEVDGAIYSRFKPTVNGSYYAQLTNGNCELTSEVAQVTLNNGSGVDCTDPFVIEFAGESVLDTLVIDGSNGADYYEFTVPANGYMAVSSCRANDSDSDHYIQAYFDSGCAVQISGTIDDCDGHFDMEMPVFEGDVLGLEIGIDPNEPAENQVDQLFDVVFYFREGLEGTSCDVAQTINCLGDFEVDLRGAEQWFVWTSPEAGEYDISLAAGAAFDHGIVLEVYQGADCNNLTLEHTTTTNPQHLLFIAADLQYYFRFLDELKGTPEGPYTGRLLGVEENNSTAEVIELTECDDYFFDNQVITESGTYHGAFTNTLGCDSLVTLNIIINESETNSVTESAFSSFEFDSNTLTASGTYNATFTNQSGCDSLVNLDLTIKEGIGWEVIGWSNTTGPSTNDLAILMVDYSTGVNGEFDMDGLKVDAGVTLIIDPGTYLEINGNIENMGTIIVKSGASILTNEGGYSGNPVTFIKETRYADNRYSMVGSPVFDDIVNTTDLLGPIVYSYDESIAYNEETEDGINRWIANQNVALSSGKGYAAAGQQTITISGIPTDGDVTLNLGRTEDATTGSENWGWHLVSNPYPASININEFLATNDQIQGSIALWDDPGSDTGRGNNGDYLTVNTLGSVGGPNGGHFNGYISSMQGFFVQVGDGQSGELQFTMDMRSVSNNADANFFRKVETPSVKFMMSTDEGSYSETLIGFPEDATTEMDRLYDAVKLKSRSAFNISSVLNGELLAIQGLPLEDEMMIPLSLDHEVGGRTSFELETLNLPDQYSVLIQNPFGEEHNLNNQSIELNISGGKNQLGYSLILRKNEVLNIQDKPSFVVFVKEGFIVIRNPQSSEIGQVKLLDLLGKAINVNMHINGSDMHLDKPDTSGIYIILIETEGEISKQKIIIH